MTSIRNRLAVLNRPLQECTRTFLDAPVLRACADLSLPRAEFNKVALARIGGGSTFILLLDRCIQLCHQADLQHPLLAPLLRNRNDELGQDGETNLRPEGSHALWRHNSCRALGLLSQDAYSVYADHLLTRAALGEVVGALTWIELSIPQEYKIILDYLKVKQPDLAADALYYFLDHARHDPGHFRELRQAIDQSDLPQEELMTGIARMSAAKATAFYGAAPSADKS